ncbi:S-adenosyl-L-methionine-dependent methyltransferase [Zychaea mexicana]|uniref:S-adenosyl-L-methionine-dependent methyltransferase n=1 Tax=Zychaea mexicana TaxID=64656 RepID=UPI0022FF2168|nr:S-adenosyl-L-methionine-dependent methyltransferase [Zychaea mexicana]KAI9490291.1 S-adenosyl-L-methionine-dependent methyltransferase [Zychaea mexicana]
MISGFPRLFYFLNIHTYMSVASDPEETQDYNNNNDIDETESVAPTFNIDNLPPSFKKFLQDNAIDPKVYTVTDLPRYIRLNTHCPANTLPTLNDLKIQLDTQQVWQVKDGIFGFIHAKQRLVDIKAYTNHTVFGIDLSSAMAVEALDLTPDDQVLDLCCAPGAKLCMIANKLGNDGVGTVTGVDIAKHRLATCRSMVKKYSVGNRVRLFDADGTTFKIPPPARVGGRLIVGGCSSTSKEEDDHHATTTTAAAADSSSNNNDGSEPVTKKRRKNTSTTKPFWASKFLRNDTQDSPHLYDKVIVDAECTHDGSISHILKYETWGWDAFEKNFMNPDRLSTICELQVERQVFRHPAITAIDHSCVWTI